MGKAFKISLKPKQYKFYPEPLPSKILCSRDKETDSQDIPNQTSFSKLWKEQRKNSEAKGLTSYTKRQSR